MNLAESTLINGKTRVRQLRRSIGPRVLNWAEPAQVARVLEIGCGQGVGIELLLDHFPTAAVVGVDIDPKMVGRAINRLKDCADRVELRLRDVCALTDDDDSFDAVVDFAAVHHVPDWPAALSEIARVLRPGGQFLFEDHDVTKHSWFARTFFAHPQERFTAEEFVAALRNAGIDVKGQLDDRNGHFVGRGVKRVA